MSKKLQRDAAQRRYDIFQLVKSKPGITSTDICRHFIENGTPPAAVKHLIARCCESLVDLEHMKSKIVWGRNLCGSRVKVSAYWPLDDGPDPIEDEETDEPEERVTRSEKPVNWPYGYAVGTVPTLGQMAHMIVNANQERKHERRTGIESPAHAG